MVGAFRALRAQGASVVDVRADTLARWSEEVQRKAAPSVWNSGGCSSWYLDEAGRNTTLWPDYTIPLRAPDPQIRCERLCTERPSPALVKRPPITLEGATALVTGAGSGIGRAAAHALAAREPPSCAPTLTKQRPNRRHPSARGGGSGSPGLPPRRGGPGRGRCARGEDRGRGRCARRPGEQRRCRYDRSLRTHDRRRVDLYPLDQPRWRRQRLLRLHAPDARRGPGPRRQRVVRSRVRADHRRVGLRRDQGRRPPALPVPAG